MYKYVKGEKFVSFITILVILSIFDILVGHTGAVDLGNWNIKDYLRCLHLPSLQKVQHFPVNSFNFFHDTKQTTRLQSLTIIPNSKLLAYL